MFRVLAIPVLATLICSGAVWAQTTVAGVVLDQAGSPVPNSCVEAFPVRSTGFAGDLTWTKADDHGNFRLTLHEGRYEIRAKDESQGYPDPNALLSVDPNALFPQVTVSKQDISGVQVKLGLKGGILEGDLRDKVTQTPVPKAKVTIRDASKPESFVEVFTDKMGHFQFTVPSKALSIFAAGQGYKTTHFEAGKPVTLSGGERRVVVIELDPQ